MKPKFESRLHPELVRRVEFVMQDLRDRGWNPFIPEIYGVYGTGYRSYADQQELKKKHPARTGVKFSFHNVTDEKGNPQAMAVHITDRSVGKKPKKDHPFILDLEAASCTRHGLVTGNQWKKPWDPLHVQLYKNKDKKKVENGERPPFLKARLVLFPAFLRLNPPPSYLPPRSIDNLMAGERFILQSHFPYSAVKRGVSFGLSN